MLVQIWTLSNYPTGGPKCVWIGDMPTIPRVGEFLGILNDFGCETVRSIVYDLPSMSVEIIIDTDDKEGQYKEVDPQFVKGGK